MRWSKFCFFLTLFSLTLSLKVAIFPSLVTAQTQPFDSLKSDTTLPPPKGDAPDDTAGGSSRDGGYCNQDNIAEGSRGFSIAMPAYTETNAERPIFSLYIPQTSAKTMFFSLKDAKEEYYYETIISVPKHSGQFRFQLPADAPAIKTNKEYSWSVSLICQQSFDPSDPILTGVIKRVEQEKTTRNSH